ncbi:MAG: DHH family phosphoesterase [Sedimentisphaerales bacterium]|nr:DHH family phosphoesterase [Sedimentisphaerales bacterium]
MPGKNGIDKTAGKFDRLKQLLQRKAAMVIVLQDNPDPDSIAAGVALRKLVNKLAKIPCTIAYGGTVGRGENRALVRYLGLNLRLCNELDFAKFDLVAMVDTQPGAGNNSLPEDVQPDIVFDHHPLRKTSRAIPFTDIRRKYGATATILLEYLTAAGITVDVRLATAILYAIRSDTQDLGREACKADIEAIGILFPRSNCRMLSVIQRGAVPKTYFRMLAEGLNNAYCYGHAMITSLGQIDNPDMIAEVADLLLREDTTNWTMCTGIYDNKLLISLRTSQETRKASDVIRKLVARRGTGGGHDTYSGGQIPLGRRTPARRARLLKTIQDKFLKAIAMTAHAPERLITIKYSTQP